MLRAAREQSEKNKNRRFFFIFSFWKISVQNLQNFAPLKFCTFSPGPMGLMVNSALTLILPLGPYLFEPTQLLKTFLNKWKTNTSLHWSILLYIDTLHLFPPEPTFQGVLRTWEKIEWFEEEMRMRERKEKKERKLLPMRSAEYLVKHVSSYKGRFVWVPLSRD